MSFLHQIICFTLSSFSLLGYIPSELLVFIGICRHKLYMLFCKTAQSFEGSSRGPKREIQ